MSQFQRCQDSIEELKKQRPWYDVYSDDEEEDEEKGYWEDSEIEGERLKFASVVVPFGFQMLVLFCLVKGPLAVVLSTFCLYPALPMTSFIIQKCFFPRLHCYVWIP